MDRQSPQQGEPTDSKDVNFEIVVDKSARQVGDVLDALANVLINLEQKERGDREEEKQKLDQ